MLETIFIFLLAMTPVGELRLSIPVAMTVYGFSGFYAYVVSVLGNMVPVVFFLLFLEPVSVWLSEKFWFFNSFFNWLFKRTRKKYDSKVKKFGYGILFFFVSIPLPITGGWTGALIAFLFGIPFRKSLPLISAGVLTAGVIVVFLTEAGISIERYYGSGLLVGIVVAVAFCWIMFKIIKKKNNV